MDIPKDCLEVFQNGFDQSSGDWVIHMDIDNFFHVFLTLLIPPNKLPIAIIRAPNHIHRINGLI